MPPRPKSQESRITVIPKGAPFLPDLDLYLDAHRRTEFGFVSHAHADHFAKHRTILCSKITAEIIAVRYGTGKSEVIALEYHEPYEHRGHRIKLLPAGHILGSAQIHITRLSDNASLLYTGDFKTRTSLAAEPPEFAHADTLIMETTFGLPSYVFPPADDSAAAIVEFALTAIEENAIPVLLGYSLGKAQEILAALADAKIPVLLHGAVFKMTEVYRRLEAAPFPPYQKFAPDRLSAGHALIFPPNVVRSADIQNIENRRTAMMTGWGMNPSAKYRYRVDEVIPLSDHADYPGLLECVEAVQPELVLTLHGSDKEFAADLRRRGVEAWSFKGTDQLELMLE